MNNNSSPPVVPGHLWNEVRLKRASQSLPDLATHLVGCSFLTRPPISSAAAPSLLHASPAALSHSTVPLHVPFPLSASVFLTSLRAPWGSPVSLSAEGQCTPSCFCSVSGVLLVHESCCTNLICFCVCVPVRLRALSVLFASLASGMADTHCGL